MRSLLQVTMLFVLSTAILHAYLLEVALKTVVSILMMVISTVRPAWVWLLPPDSMPAVSKPISMVQRLMQHLLMFESGPTLEPVRLRTTCFHKNFTNLP